MIDLTGQMIVLHGPPKVGKTQMVCSWPKPVFFFGTDRGHKWIHDDCTDLQLRPGKKGWDQFKVHLLKLKALGRSKFPKTLCIDMATDLYYNCMEWVCSRDGIEHPSDGDHGKGWAAVRMEFSRRIFELASLCDRAKSTFFIIDHSKMETITTAVGSAYTKISVTMPGQARGVLLPPPDFIWYLGYDNPITGDKSVDVLKDFSGGRVLYIDGNHCIEAGNRARGISVKVIENLPETNQFEHITKVLNRKSK